MAFIATKQISIRTAITADELLALVSELSADEAFLRARKPAWDDLLDKVPPE